MSSEELKRRKLHRFVESRRTTCLDVYKRDPSLIEEHANIEGRAREGGYSNRQIFELIQNAADAITDTESNGRIRILLTANALYAANTGEPITLEGIDTILRSHVSHKRGQEIGRFGLGFKSLLGISTQILIVSDGTAIEFDRQRALQALEQLGHDVDESDIPVLRLAWAADACPERLDDHHLDDMLQWAQTVIRVRLNDDDGWDRMVLELSGFPSEFLLFSAADIEVGLEAPDSDPPLDRHISRTTGGPIVTLEEGGDAAQWRTFSSTVKLNSEAAKRDGGKLNWRPELPCVWAIPEAGGIVPRGRFWKFFPLQEVGRVPGILNSAWKTNDDRTSLIPGPFNDGLMDHAAVEIANAIPSLAREDDPCRPLDYLPRRDGGSAAAGGLAGRLWSELAEREIVADCDGRLRKIDEVWLHPVTSPELIAEWLSIAPSSVKQEYVHPSVFKGRERTARLGSLAANLPEDQQDRKAGLNFWITDVVSAAPPASAAAVLLAARVLEASDNAQRDLEIMADAKFLLTAAGELVAFRGLNLVFAVDDSSPAGVIPIHPDLTGREDVARALRDWFGVCEIGEEHWDRALRVSMPGPHRTGSATQWKKFWEILRKAPKGVAEQLLAGSPGRIHVIAQDGQARHWSTLIVPGDFVESVLDCDLSEWVVDKAFHEDDLELLGHLGITDGPRQTDKPIDDPAWKDYSTGCVRRYRNKLRDRDWRRTPQHGYLVVDDPGSGIAPVGLLTGAGPGVAAACTRWAIQHFDDWDFERSARVVHKSTPNAYPRDIKVSNYLRWLVRRNGRWPIGTECLPLAKAFGLLKAQPMLWRTVPARFGELKDEVCQNPLYRSADAVKPTTEIWARLLDGDVAAWPAEHRLDFYSAAADCGYAPSVVHLDDREIAVGDLLVTQDAALLELARSAELPGLLLNEVGIATFIEAGSRLLDAQLKPAIAEASLPTGLTAVEAFPEFVDFVDEADVPLIIFGRNLHLQMADLPQSSADARNVLWWDETIYLDLDWVEGSSRGHAIEAICELLWWQDLLESDPQKVMEAIAEGTVRDARAAVALAPSLPARLLMAVGGHAEALKEAFVPPLRQHLEDCRVSSDSIAELFIASHGTDSLRVLSRLGHLDHLDPPGSWRAGPTTETFVQALGFPAAYAGSTLTKLPPIDVVQGPITLNPLHKDYQTELFEDLVDLFTDFRGRARGMLCLPTGGGKTRVAVEAVVEAVLRNRERPPLALWVADRAELCEQAVRCFWEVWHNKGLDDTPLHIHRLWGGNPEPVAPERDQPSVVIASIQTLSGRIARPSMPWLKTPSVVVIDEAHHAIATTYTGLLKWLMNEGDRSDPCAVLGLSATPHRGIFNEVDSLRLKNRFDGRLFPAAERLGLQEQLLRKAKVLAEPTYEYLETHIDFDFSEAEISRMNTFHGSVFPETANGRLADNPVRNDTIVKRLLELAQTDQILLFANGREHAQYLAGRLQLNGCTAAAIVGETRPGVRRDFVSEFKAGRIRVLCNYEVLTTGFDAPKVDTVFIARPTFSSVLYRQMIGRGLRGPRNGGRPTCRIVTVEDNFARFGEGLAYHDFKELWLDR